MGAGLADLSKLVAHTKPIQHLVNGFLRYACPCVHEALFKSWTTFPHHSEPQRTWCLFTCEFSFKNASFCYW